MLNLRRLKVLAVLLVLSNLILGGVSVHLIRRLNQQYSTLVESSMGGLSEVRGAGRQASLVFRTTVAALVTDDPTECSAEIGRARGAEMEGRKLREAILAMDVFRQNTELRLEYEAVGKEFDAVVDDLLPRITADDTAARERVRFMKLESLYDRFTTVNSRISDSLGSRAGELSTTYSSQTNRETMAIIGFAGWPLVLAAGLVFLTAIVVLVMILAFRREIAADEP